jgi:hypothetical protein
MKPITTRIKESRSGTSYPMNQEVTMNADGGGGPIDACGCGSPAKLKDACYKKVAARYSGGNSAYRSGAMAKCRKVGVANWGNSKK